MRLIAATDQATAQVLDEGFDLGQLGHGSESRQILWGGSQWDMAQQRTSSHRGGLPRPPR